MTHKNHMHAVGEATWKLLLHHQIPPTPRNFEWWFSYCNKERPGLGLRIEEFIKASKSFTSGMLDDLYQEFFSNPVELRSIEDDAQEPHVVAAQMAKRVIADCDMIGEYGAALTEWSFPSIAAPTLQDIRHSVKALKTVTTEASERMRALEQLLVASVLRTGELSDKLARATKAATHDGLTGLANRRMFDATLSAITLRAKQCPTEVALLFLDIDHFKKFNDAYGHSMGDHVLRLVAQVLRNQIKGRDIAARYGGEEFAIILVDVDLTGAITVAEQIRMLLEQRPLMNRVTGQKLGAITCSIGVALYRPNEACGELIDRADNALYEAKRAGRNQVMAERTEPLVR